MTSKTAERQRMSFLNSAGRSESGHETTFVFVSVTQHNSTQSEPYQRTRSAQLGLAIHPSHSTQLPTKR